MTEEMKKRRFGLLKYALIVLAVIIAIPACWYLWNIYQMGRAEKLIARYLEKKYHKEFVVKNGHYIWANNSYTFDAFPKDDPEFQFPVFIHGIYENGIGDMYMNEWRGREAHKLLDTFINTISHNNYYGAMYGAGVYSRSKEWKDIMGNIYDKMLTPLQATRMYPGKIYMNTNISYAFDVTDSNKPEIFKKVFALVEFLNQKGFGYINITIGFYPTKMFAKQTIREAYDHEPGSFEMNNFQHLIYRINIPEESIKNIVKWEDIRKYADRKKGVPENCIWERDED